MRPTPFFSASLSVMALAITLSLPATAQSIPGCDPAVLAEIDRVAADRGQQDARGLDEFHKKIKDFDEGQNCVNASFTKLDVSSVAGMMGLPPQAVNKAVNEAISKGVKEACEQVRDEVRQRSSVYTGEITGRLKGLAGDAQGAVTGALGGTAGNVVGGLVGGGLPSGTTVPNIPSNPAGPFDGVVDLFRPKPKPPVSGPVIP